jgi:formyl-CoA transferase
MILDGVRVLDFTQQEQGPVATQMLGDFGAEIIKFERTRTGDGMRGSAKGGVNGMPCYGSGFVAFNRNKKSVAIDLKAPEGRQVVYELARTSDVVVSNFRPGVMERLGFGYEDLSKINPRIIVAYGSGYGQTGPYRDRIGQDMAGQAMGGMTAQSAHHGNPPVVAGYDTCDLFGGMILAHGITLALMAREKTGCGQVVDSCLLNTGVVGPSKQAVEYLNHGTHRPMKNPEPKPRNPVYSIYETGDGRYLMAVGVFSSNPIPKMCRALEIAEEVAWADAYDHVQEGMRKFTTEEIVKRFDEQDVVAAPVNEFPHVFEDPQVLHNGLLLEGDHPVAGHVKMVGFPFDLSDTPATLRMVAPLLGEHNEEVLGKILGMSEEQIRDLYDRGVISNYKSIG